MKVAVTCASGQLGSAIIAQLAPEIGVENVVGIARTPSKAEHLGVEIRKGDYNDEAQMNAALRGIDSLLIISGNGAPDLRIQQHRNVIEAAKDNNVRKLVYTSIIGNEKETAFNPVVKSNRRTEQDIQESGLDWIIGRNSIYIEPDVEYIEHYKAAGKVINAAGSGKCGYTSRKELAVAYSKLLQRDDLNSRVYNLLGKAISQQELVTHLNAAFNTKLTYNPVSVAEYEADRKEALGEFMGTIIAGIYESMSLGCYDLETDFEKITGRVHQSPSELIASIKKEIS